jgi:hypothetical protein
MNKPQFTPGPWHTESNQFTIWDAKHAVAAVYNTMAPEPMASTARANAQLIAAAPELLLALQGCLEWMDFTIPRLKGHCPHCKETVDAGGLNWGGPIHKARTAIAKAIGN